METRLATVAMPWTMEHPWETPRDAMFTKRGEWPATWINLPEVETPVVCAYRLRFSAATAGRVRVYASGDERYDLFLDGVRIGRGPERGSPQNWYFEGYDLDLAVGEHVLVARVWSLGVSMAPWSTMRVAHGVVLAAEDETWNGQLGTGVATWEGRVLPGYVFKGGTGAAWAANETIDAASFGWGFECGEGDGWSAVRTAGPGRTKSRSSFVHTFEPSLRPGRLPRLQSDPRYAARVRVSERMTEPDAAYTGDGDKLGVAGLTRGEPVVIPARLDCRVLLDFDDYVNVFPSVRVHDGAGARVEIAFAEALHLPGEPRAKGDRNDIAGKVFPGRSAVFLPDGPARNFETLWWRAGRYVQLRITTADAPLVLDAVVFEETGYPYPEDGAFACDDPTLMELMAICTRTARRCARESFMDCPYYEQQQWVGDMRVQMLISHVVLRDSRLVKRCIEFIGDAREGDDMVFGRYPAPQRLWIPSFALAWCGMVYDLARWRDERDFVAARMPALRATLDRFLRSVGDDDLLVVPAGWNYTDWAEGWRNGEPCPSGEPNAVLQMWLVWVLGQAVELETWLEEPEFSARWARHRGRLTASAVGAYWHEDSGLFSDDVGGTRFSEFANALAVLSCAFPARYVDRLRETLPEAGAGVTRCALYADSYLLDAFVSLGRMDAYEKRLERYRAFMEQGLMTTPEHPGTTRSDCHAWSAHPRYHAVASVLGIRPDAFGFGRVLIRPQLGGLDRAAGSVPHPNGTITCEVRREGDGLSGWVDLPPGTTGAFVCPDGRELTLVSGRTGLG